MNGLDINVRQEDFKSKPPEERDWMLYQGVQMINLQGCKWGKDNHHFNRSRWVIVGFTALGTGLGFAVGIWQALCK